MQNLKIILTYLQHQLDASENHRKHRATDTPAYLILCGRRDAYEDAIQRIHNIIAPATDPPP